MPAIAGWPALAGACLRQASRQDGAAGTGGGAAGAHGMPPPAGSIAEEGGDAGAACAVHRDPQPDGGLGTQKGERLSDRPEARSGSGQEHVGL